MNKQYRSYSDHEIANYVLGIELPETQAKGIQHNLASDNAAAARALKWEAYFLSMVDGLEPINPKVDNLEKIQTSLNIKIAALENKGTNDSLDTNQSPSDPIQAADIPSKKKINGKLKLAIGILVLLIIGFISWASLKAPTEPAVIQQTIDLK